jgi:acyl dehydratase
MDTEVQTSIATVSVGDEIEPVSIPITLQRLVMEAGANRDFSLIHHDCDVARATGASDAYANTFFIAGMFERLLRNWMGPTGFLNKISTLRMSNFIIVGDLAEFSATVTAVDAASTKVDLDLSASTANGTCVTANATVTLPT